MELLERLLDGVGIRTADIVDTERISGLTNTNFRVRTHDDEVIVRIASAERACAHGMSREAEAQILTSAEAAGLGAEVLLYELPDGHLVTRKLAAATYDLAPERFRDSDVFTSLIERVKCIHALPKVDHRFNPYAKIEAVAGIVEREGLWLPNDFTRLLEKMAQIKNRWIPLDPALVAPCHNDLFSVNIVQTSPLRFIDWECAGVGDIFFDLATLLVATDDVHPLGIEHRRMVLDVYFGCSDETLLAHLDDMVFMVRLHAGVWGIIQQMLRVPEPNGFTYTEYTKYMLDQLIGEL